MSMTAQEKIQIIQDQEDGYQIQVRKANSNDKWIDIAQGEAEFNFARFEYRRKPDPGIRLVVRWVGITDRGITCVYSDRECLETAYRNLVSIKRVELVEGEFDE
jgi:hypothetical protein